MTFHEVHREQQTDVPDPMAPAALLSRVVGLGLPAEMLSVVSGLVFAIALVVVGASSNPAAVVPGALTVWLALPSAGLAWLIVAIASRRPGGLGPRLWALGLAVWASLFVIVALANGAPGSPRWLAGAQVSALALGTFAAVLALAPRLVRVHPGNPWIQRVAPLTLLVVLLLVLPVAMRDTQKVVNPREDQDVVAWRASVQQVLRESQFDSGAASSDWDDLPWLFAVELQAARDRPQRNGCNGQFQERPGREATLDCRVTGQAAPAPMTGARLEIIYDLASGQSRQSRPLVKLRYRFALDKVNSGNVPRGIADATLQAFQDALPAAGLSADADQGAVGESAIRVRRGAAAWRVTVAPPESERTSDADGTRWVVIEVRPLP